MGDWRKEIDDLFKSRGFEKKVPELSESDQRMIQEFIENIGKPAFENFCDELNSFHHVKAEVEALKKSREAIMEQIELTVFNMMQPKLTYRLKFQKKGDGVYIIGEYSTPNIYGENTRFHDSTLDRLMTGTSEEDIARDLSTILESKF
jgi:hypothetical protein